MKKYIVWIFISLFPFVTWGLSQIFDSNFIIELIEIIYQYPILIIDNSLFQYQHDIGFIPTHSSRLATVVLYSVVYWIVVMLYKRVTNERKKGDIKNERHQ